MHSNLEFKSCWVGSMAKAGKDSTAKDKDGAEAAVRPSRLRLEAAPDNNIRNWRLFRKIERHDDLANLTVMHDPEGVGISRVNLCRLETGELRWNRDHITILSRTLGVAPGDLIGINPFNSGDVFAVYASLSLVDKQRAVITISVPPKPQRRSKKSRKG